MVEALARTHKWWVNILQKDCYAYHYVMLGINKEKILRRIIEDERGCWRWQGARDDRGYGILKIGGHKTRAQRLSYRLFIGEIPPGQDIHHRCGNPGCVNPAHLEAVEKSEHVELSANNVTLYNRAKTHCVYGHPFDEANTLIRKGGGRICRICNNRRVKEWHARQGKKTRRPAGVVVELVI